MEKRLKIDIFSTPIYVGEVADKNLINYELSLIDTHKLVRRVDDHLPEWACNVQTGHEYEDGNTDDDLWVKVFKKAIEPNVTDYINSIRDVRIEFQYHFDTPWLNIYQKGDYQEMHQHAGGVDGIGNVLSYAYMHKLPDNGGRFFFGNTRDYANYIGQATSVVRTSDMRYYPEATEGYIIIFPAWLHHMVEPNRGDEERVTISGNIYFTY